jgi:hypothetical protein
MYIDTSKCIKSTLLISNVLKIQCSALRKYGGV